MYTICLRYCKDPDEAADVLQEGFITVFQKIDQFRYDGNIEAWIRTVIVRSAIHLIKKKVKFLPIEEHIDAMEEYEMKVDFDHYTYKRLLKHIHTMPVGYQAVFNLYVFEEMSHSEIAVELDISESTSRSQLFKARKMMQHMISKDGQLKPLVKLWT